MSGMKTSAAFVLIALLAIGAFGFLGMNSGMDHDGGCIASLVNAAACPLTGLSSALYHTDAYASFTQAVFASSLVLLALALLAILALARSSVLMPISTPARAVFLAQCASGAPQQKFFRWLALFENSPSAVCGA